MSNTNIPAPFLFNNNNMKLCSICGLEKKLTFEHMPPKASGNTKPVKIIGLENMTPLGGYLYQKSKKSHQGMGGYKLCESCNNLTGAWYAKSYIDLSNQITEFIKDNLGKKNLELTCKIRPLNFLKQVICILLCSDQATGILRSKIKKTNFILKKEENQLSEDIFISKIITLQPTYGFKGFTSGWDSNNGYSNNIEFIYRPFYFHATFSSTQSLQHSFNLMDFKKYNYNEEIEIRYDLDLTKFNYK